MKRPSAGVREVGKPVSRAAGHARLPPLAAQSTAARRRPAVPRITSAFIAEGRYELVRAPDHAETRAWHVLVGGRLAGLVRPTWRGERSRPGWEPVDTAGTALPATGSAGSPPPGTPAPAMPPQSACCGPCSASRNKSARRPPAPRPRRPHSRESSASSYATERTRPSNSPLRTPSRNASHSDWVKRRTGPSGSLLSRTRILWSGTWPPRRNDHSSN